MLLHSKIEGEGSPLVIIHGYLGMSDNWKTLAAQYVEQGFQVHALDMRNHGKSFHSADWGYDFMVQDVVEYCEFTSIKKHFGYWSFNGRKSSHAVGNDVS